MSANPSPPNPNAIVPAAPQAIEPRVAGFVESVRGLLVPGEQVQAWAAQRRLFALVHRRVFVVATSGRLLVFDRNLIAGYRMQDVRWQDLHAIRIRTGLFAADLEVGFGDASDLSSSSGGGGSAGVGGGQGVTAWRVVRGLRVLQAQEVYRIAQAHDQAWREKRRIRDLEEMRARAGGVQMGAPPGMAGALPAGGPDDLPARLQRAKEMADRGLITDAEYEAIKAKIISGL